MRSLRNAIVIGTALFGVTSIASAQGATPIPAQYMPPAGMCRVWLGGVIPARQPAPTTCDVARANLRANSRLVYGPALRGVPIGQNGSVMSNGRIGQGGQSVCTDANRDGICDYRQQNNGRNGEWDKRAEKEHRKAERKARKEREKEWKREHKRHGHHDGDDDHDDDDDDRGERGRDSRGNQNGTYGRGVNIPGAGRVSFP